MYIHCMTLLDVYTLYDIAGLCKCYCHLYSYSAVGHLQIVQHPQPQVIPQGAPVTLTCRATFTPTNNSNHLQQQEEEVTYVWYMNGLSLLENMKSDYHIPCMTEEDEGMYSCEVSSLTQSIMSNIATLSLDKT